MAGSEGLDMNLIGRNRSFQFKAWRVLQVGFGRFGNPLLLHYVVPSKTAGTS